MLVITRLKGESVLIGEDVEVIVSDVKSDRVKLSISAPREINIVRTELLEIGRENRSASKNVSSNIIDDLRKKINE